MGNEKSASPCRGHTITTGLSRIHRTEYRNPIKDRTIGRILTKTTRANYTTNASLKRAIKRSRRSDITTIMEIELMASGLAFGSKLERQKFVSWLMYHTRGRRTPK